MPDSDYFGLCALCIWREARGEGTEGMRAVAHVIKNRIGKPRFASTLDEVILGKNQFSSMSIPSDSEYHLYPKTGDVQSAYCIALVPQVFDGTDLDNTNGALYYANLADSEQGGWFFRNIVNNLAHPETAVIGKQTFFA